MTKDDYLQDERLMKMPMKKLIARMEKAADFGYDDEASELTSRLAMNQKAWKLDKHNRIIIYNKTIKEANNDQH